MELNLGGNPLTTQCFQILSHAIRKIFLKGFKLGLSGNYFEKTQPEAKQRMLFIAEALESGECPEGFSLNLSYSDLSDECFEILIKAMLKGKLPKYFELDLSRTNLTSEQIIQLADALMSGKLPRGFSLKLAKNKNGFNPRIASWDRTPSNRIFNYFLDALTHVDCPRELSLDLSSSSGPFFQKLSKVLIDNKSLVKLNVSNNEGLSLDLAHELQSGLMRNTVLQEFLDHPKNSFFAPDLDYIEEDTRQYKRKLKSMKILKIIVLPEIA
ncbi:MAG: hypothetical protein H0U71_01580 [Gammaproteobacteria bacterium]|nr:hypothetical protein [Gammaproteobacteria bacterium]